MENTHIRKIAVIGSTGNIGCQALEVMAALPQYLKAEVLVASENVELLAEQAKKVLPEVAIILNKEKYRYLKEALSDYPIKVFCGEESLLDVLTWDSTDMVLNAFVGFAGLRTTHKALESRKPVALANKESLVVAGEILIKLASEKRVPLLPVDSEHSAIFQCLTGEHTGDVKKLILTASGGPFRGMKKTDMNNITPAKALKHPNWSMGAKITIDSSTLMNKGLEVIEAHWLFNIPVDNIEVIIHPQSIIHSMVMFADGSVKAQMGLPDMRFPIQYALCYPSRPANPFPKDFLHPQRSLHFELPDRENFPCLDLAYEAIRKGGNIPCALNAANEVAVDLFLKEHIAFLQIPQLIEQGMHYTSFNPAPDMENLIETDREVRRYLYEKYGPEN